jgi:integrase
MNTLRDAVQEYLELRRGLGFKLREAGNGLIDFVTFLEQHKASFITQKLALEWAQQPPNARPAYWAARLSFVRGFARYRSATDQRTQIPPMALLPFKPKRARPYLYSDEEIRSLLRAALRMPYRFERWKLRPWVYYCLFGLLSVSGLRLGEARNLDLQDVDLKAAVLTIRGTKFGKTRLVPLHPTTCKVLANYIARRRRIGPDVQCPPICSFPAGVIVWIAETFTEPSILCLARLVCEELPTVAGLVCTTCAIGSRQTPSCDGTGPARIPRDDYPYCLPTSATCTSPIRNGIWRDVLS